MVRIREDDERNLVVPEGIVDLSHAFARNLLLESVVLPDSVRDITGAFYRCRNLRQVQLPAFLPEIGERAFAGCENLKEITIPYGVTTIGRDAFAGCGLQTIRIPETVTYIAGGAFYNCRDLVDIQIASAQLLYTPHRCPDGTNCYSIIAGTPFAAVQGLAESRLFPVDNRLYL